MDEHTHPGIAMTTGEESDYVRFNLKRDDRQDFEMQITTRQLSSRIVHVGFSPLQCHRAFFFF